MAIQSKPHDKVASLHRRRSAIRRARLRSRGTNQVLRGRSRVIALALVQAPAWASHMMRDRGGWTRAEWACSFNNTDQLNSMCTTETVYACQLGWLRLGWQYPGQCGCPSFCSNATARGVCVDRSCHCYPGYQGFDCSNGNAPPTRATTPTYSTRSLIQCVMLVMMIQ